MSKQEQIIQLVTEDIIEMIVEEKKVEYDEAMNKFYSSDIFTKLNDIETGLYLESSAYIYELFKDELIHGCIIQNEI